MNVSLLTCFPRDLGRCPPDAHREGNLNPPPFRLRAPVAGDGIIGPLLPCWLHREVVCRATLFHELACFRPELGQLEQLFFASTHAPHLPCVWPSVCSIRARSGTLSALLPWLLIMSHNADPFRPFDFVLLLVAATIPAKSARSLSIRL